MFRQTFQNILSLVQRPSHYLGSEPNAIIKDPAKIDLRFALVFPDLYDIGMSYLGMKILYHILNSRQRIYAERVFTPREDMEAQLRAKNIPLCSLETRTPLSSFDIVGVSLLYELNYTNILTILDLAGIPIYASERDISDPVVIAGGPKCESELEVFEFVHDGMQKGAIGVNLGRNIWQNPHPVAMMRALNTIIHDNATPEQAFDLFETVKRSK